MRAGWSVGLDVLAKGARKATRKISANSREGTESRETTSQAYVPLRRPSLQSSAPVTSVRPSANGNVVHLPLESFDIGAFLRELDALRRCMTEAAPAFDEVRTKYGAAVAQRQRRHTSAVDLAAMNDALARAVKRLGKSRS
jgi:hypothetical protein